MQISRRSFLAAIGAALATKGASAKAPAPQFIPSGMHMTFFATNCVPQWSGPIYRPFMIWDTAKVEPNQVLNAKLLPPPTPAEFLINGMRIDFPPSTRRNSLIELAESVVFELRGGSKTLLQAPVFQIGMLQDKPKGFMELALPLQRRDDLGIHLFSTKKVELDRAEQIHVTFTGVLKS